MSMSNAPQLVVALDFHSAQPALQLATQLRHVVPWCKVGMELFTLAGPRILSDLAKMNFKIFLDLKFYDIPNTVAKAVKAASAVGVNMITLHCQGGERMCRAAVESATSLPSPPLLFGVTVLTSFGAGEMPGVQLDPTEFAPQLARCATQWGLDGVVCSGHEVAAIKKSCPSLRCLCPGIRPAGVAADDQRRVMTPADAISAGADFLVIGRPITSAPDPLKAACQIKDEILLAVQSTHDNNAPF